MSPINSQISPSVLQEIQQKLQSDGIQKTVVGAVIIQQNGDLLLLERAADDFMGGVVELPSGTVDAGEELLTALVREVKEETALDVQSIDAFIGSFDYTSGSGKRTRQLNFRVTVGEGEVALNPSEHSRYFSLKLGSEALSSLNISQETLAIINKA